MAAGDKIELFKFIKKTYRRIGIDPLQKRRRTNAKNCFMIYSLAISFVSPAVYLLLEANSMFDYGITVFSCSTEALSFTTYLILFWQAKNFSHFIENYERFIETSEYEAIPILFQDGEDDL